MSGYRIEHGDCLALLKREPPDSFDSMVTDPPGGIGFMGRDWDKDRGGRRAWVKWLKARLKAAYRVLKPGAHAFVWALPRTSHWTGMALEEAGFEVRDCPSHAFGSGFPKSHNLPGGLGTALKPGHELWFLVRKPLEKGLTVAQNVAKWGTGAINIDACRVAGTQEPTRFDPTKHRHDGWRYNAHGSETAARAEETDGRWPPNLLLTHSAGCKRVGTAAVKANPTWDTPNRDTAPSAFTGETVSAVKHGDDAEDVAVWECCNDCPVRLMDQQSGDRPVSGAAALGRTNASGEKTGYQNGWQDARGVLHNDSGTASRFFPQFEWTELDDLAPFYYCAKASRAERDRGLENFAPRAAQRDTPNPGGIDEGARNTHPTGKSVELMRYLCRLTTPPKGRVLDPFLGSGTTLVACVAEGFEVVGFELNDTEEEPFVSIARARLAHALGYSFIPRESLRAVVAPKQRSLFEQETS